MKLSDCHEENFSIGKGYDKLRFLFYKQPAFGKLKYSGERTEPEFSYYDCLEEIFLDWSMRGDFISALEMMTNLGISENDFKQGVTETILVKFIQFVLNSCVFVEKSVASGRYEFYEPRNSVFNAIVQYSCHLINKIGVQLESDGRELWLTKNSEKINEN